MTLLCCRLAASCLLVGNYLNSWRNKLECVSLHKNTKNGLSIQMIYNGGGSKTGYFGCMIRSVSLLRIRKKWIQSAVTRNSFNTYNSSVATLRCLSQRPFLNSRHELNDSFYPAQFLQDLHCSSSKRQIETLRRGDVQHFTITFHNVGTVQSDQSALAWVIAGVERDRR